MVELLALSPDLANDNATLRQRAGDLLISLRQAEHEAERLGDCLRACFDGGADTAWDARRSLMEHLSAARGMAEIILEDMPC